MRYEPIPKETIWTILDKQGNRYYLEDVRTVKYNRQVVPEYKIGGTRWAGNWFNRPRTDKLEASKMEEFKKSLLYKFTIKG